MKHDQGLKYISNFIWLLWNWDYSRCWPHYPAFCQAAKDDFLITARELVQYNDKDFAGYLIRFMPKKTLTNTVKPLV